MTEQPHIVPDIMYSCEEGCRLGRSWERVISDRLKLGRPCKSGQLLDKYLGVINV